MMRALMAAAACAALAACGFGASYPTFGEASYRIEGMARNPDGGAPLQTIIYRDGSKMRVETAAGAGGPVAIVFDEATNAAYVLDNTTRTAVLVPNAETPEPMEAPWAALGSENAQRVGDCSVAGERGDEWRARSENGEGESRVACITRDGIVLRVRENERVIFEATNLGRGEQQPALFGVPAGYQTVDPMAALAQVGETMEQLDSVEAEGAAATPARTNPQQRATTQQPAPARTPPG